MFLQFLACVVIIIAAFRIVASAKASGQDLSKSTVTELWILSIAVPIILQWMMVEIFAPPLKVTSLHWFFIDAFRMQLETADYFVDFFWRTIGVVAGIFVVRAIISWFIIKRADQIKYKDVLINRLSIRYGSIIGVVLVILFVVFYVINPVLQFTNTWTGWLRLTILIVLLVVFGLNTRKALGGYWSFADAFKSLIIMAILSTMIFTAYSFVLNKFIDPKLPEKANKAMLDKFISLNPGLSESTIDEYTQSYKNGQYETELRPTFNNILFNFGGELLLYAIINLIIAACIKRNVPLVASKIEDEPSV